MMISATERSDDDHNDIEMGCDHQGGDVSLDDDDDYASCSTGGSSLISDDCSHSPVEEVLSEAGCIQIKQPASQSRRLEKQLTRKSSDFSGGALSFSEDQGAERISRSGDEGQSSDAASDSNDTSPCSPDPLELQNKDPKGDSLVVSLSNLKLLPTKPALPEASEADLQSATSRMSLVSVVGDLMNFPMEIFQAVVANFNGEDYGAYSPEYTRAEFLSATVIKPSGESLGLQLDCDPEENILSISSIDPTGIWSAAPFRNGDKIISLNFEKVSGWSAERLLECWQTLTGHVTLVIQNVGGDSQWVESMITKADPSERTGLAMISSRLGRIKISRIKGLSEASLLNMSDQIFFINGASVEGCNTADTASMILQATKHVTIVARTVSRTGYVVSCEQSPSVTTVVIDRDSSTAARRPLVNQSERCDNCHFLGGSWSLSNTLQLLGNLYVIFLLLLGLGYCMDKSASMALVAGILVTIVVFMYLVNSPWRRYELLLKQKLEDAGCSEKTVWQRLVTCPQISYNIILTGAFIFLVTMWYNQQDGRHNNTSSSGPTITHHMVWYLILIAFFPLLIFINLPSVIPFPEKPKLPTTVYGERTEEEDDGEIHAVASLVEEV